jgi:hypothetical protein
MGRDPRRTAARRWLAAAIAGGAVLASAALGGTAGGPTAALAVLTGPQRIGGFEIDGDLYSGTMSPASQAGDDWAEGNTGMGLVTGPSLVDPIGHGDTTNFAVGAKESQDPETWHAIAGTAPGKADFGNVYEASRMYGGQLWLYLGLERVLAGGTVYFDFELDQQPDITNTHGVAIPARTKGDVLLQATQHGNGLFTFGATYQTWSCTDPAMCDATGVWSAPQDATAAFYGLANDVAINAGPWTDAIASKDMIGTGQFAEMAVDLTALMIAPGCETGGFMALNVRSVASDAQSGQTPELKDYATMPMSIGSCSIPSIVTPTPTLAFTGGSPTPTAKVKPTGGGPGHTPSHSLPNTAAIGSGSDPTSPMLPLILLGLGGLTVVISRLKPVTPRR